MRKLYKQAVGSIVRTSMLSKRIGEKSGLEKGVKILSYNQRSFAEKKDPEKAPKEIKAEETGGYYKEKIDKNDVYYDPYNPYVWMHVLPRSWQPYLRFCRIDQNFGRMLLLNPHLWGIAIASPLGGLPDLINLWLFSVGSLFSHAASCAIDDFEDVEVDKKIFRTSRRPLVAGTLTRPKGAVIIAGLLGGTFGVLSMLSPMAIKVGLLATPCVFAYPLMKRFFQYPQVFLAFSLNLGVFMGFGAVANYISWPICLPMYIAGITYTVFYDSIYAFQDIEQDAKAGTFSTSQKFAKHAKIIMSSLAATTVSLHTLAGYFAGLHPAFLAMMGIGGAQLAWMTWKLDVKNAPLCDHLLNISYRYGVWVFMAYMLGVFLAKKKKSPEKTVEESKCPAIPNH